MERSFLNIVTIDGRICRIAELGFHADRPSFDGGGIIFRQGDKYKKICLDTGMMTSASEPQTECIRTSPSGSYSIRCEIEQPDENGFGYVHLILTDKEKNPATVLTRFMVDENSLGAMPLPEDSVSIAFFGYPERELG